MNERLIMKNLEISHAIQISARFNTLLRDKNWKQNKKIVEWGEGGERWDCVFIAKNNDILWNIYGLNRSTNYSDT